MSTIVGFPFRVLEPKTRNSWRPSIEIDVTGDEAGVLTPFGIALACGFVIAALTLVAVISAYPPKPSGFNWRGAAIAACYYGMVVCGIMATLLIVRLVRMISEDRRHRREVRNLQFSSRKEMSD